MTRIRHTVIFTWYDTTTREQKEEVIKRLNEMGDWLKDNVGVTDWVVAEHIPETFKARRSHLLQDCIFPSLEALESHGSSDAHHRVVELTPQVSDWMTVDTIVPEEA
jgi:hypothetical protein